MFRLGGPANEGITSGLAPRQGYANGDLVKSAEERRKVLSELAGPPNLNIGLLSVLIIYYLY
jgi:hypothetical protein